MYTFISGAWSDCPQGCGLPQSSRNRTVVCQDQDGKVRPDSDCGTKPATTDQGCPATVACSSLYSLTAGSGITPASCPTDCGIAANSRGRWRTWHCIDGASAQVNMDNCPALSGTAVRVNDFTTEEHFACPQTAACTCSKYQQDGGTCNSAGYSLVTDLAGKKCAFHTTSQGCQESECCTPSPCNVSQPPAHGSLGTCASGTILPSQTCQPACDVGYTPSGPTTCLVGTVAMGPGATTHATCELGCIPGSIGNGTVGNCPITMAAGATCTPTCDAGYTPSTSELTCATGGVLSSFKCMSDCVVTLPVNTTAGDCGTSLAHGTTCQPVCSDSNFKASGPLQCSDGAVTTPVICQPKCTVPTTGNGTNSCPMGSQIDYGTTCTVTCSTGYTPTPRSTMTCGDSGSLSAVTCEPNCNTVTAPAGGQMGTCTGSLVSGATCQPICPTGYDHPAPTQCDGGVVTVDVCRPSSCTPTTPPSNGALNGALGSCPSPMAHGAVCVPVCADGYEPAGNSTCSYGTFTSALCQPKSCAVSAPQNGNLGTCTTTPMQTGTDCAPTCKTGYSLDPPGAKSTCTLGVFTSATCKPLDCTAVAPAFGSMGTCTTPMASGTTCVPACATGYQLSSTAGTSSCSLGVFTSAECERTPTVETDSTAEQAVTTFAGAVSGSDFIAQLRAKLLADNSNVPAITVIVAVTKYVAKSKAAFTLPSVSAADMSSAAATAQLQKALAASLSGAVTVSASDIEIISIVDAAASGRRRLQSGATVNYAATSTNQNNQIAATTSDTSSFAATLKQQINAAGSAIPTITGTVTADTPTHETEIEYQTVITAPVGTTVVKNVTAADMQTIGTSAKVAGTPDITQAPIISPTTTTPAVPPPPPTTPPPPIVVSEEEETPFVAIAAAVTCGIILLIVLGLCCVPGRTCDTCRDNIGVGGCVGSSYKQTDSGGATAATGDV